MINSFLSGEYNQVLIALGGNLRGQKDSPVAQIDDALRQISEAGLKVDKVSQYWKTPAIPLGSGPDFVNAAICCWSQDPPVEILSHLHAIEHTAGRVRAARWGARVLDLDLLAVGQMVLPDAGVFRQWMTLPPDAHQHQAPETLILPHPRLQERAFVLAPLVEVAPDWVHPVLNKSVVDLHAALPGQAFEGMVPISREIHTGGRADGLCYPSERSKDGS